MCNGSISSNCHGCPTSFLLLDVLSSLALRILYPLGFSSHFNLTAPSRDHLLVPLHFPNPEWSWGVSEFGLPYLTPSFDSLNATSNIIYMLMMPKHLHLICTSPWNPDAFNDLFTISTWMSNRHFEFVMSWTPNVTALPQPTPPEVLSISINGILHCSDPKLWSHPWHPPSFSFS